MSHSCNPNARTVIQVCNCIWFCVVVTVQLWYRFVFVSVFCICYVWMTKYVLFKHPHQEDGRMEVFAQREIKKGDEVNMNAMADIFNISLWWPCLHFGDASPPRLLNDDKWSRWWSCTPPCCCRWWSPTPPCCPPSLKGRTSLLASGSSHAHAQGDIAYMVRTLFSVAGISNSPLSLWATFLHICLIIVHSMPGASTQLSLEVTWAVLLALPVLRGDICFRDTFKLRRRG